MLPVGLGRREHTIGAAIACSPALGALSIVPRNSGTTASGAITGQEQAEAQLDTHISHVGIARNDQVTSLPPTAVSLPSMPSRKKPAPVRLSPPSIGTIQCGTAIPATLRYAQPPGNRCHTVCSTKINNQTI